MTSSSPGASGCFCGSAAHQAVPFSTARPAHGHVHATPVGGVGGCQGIVPSWLCFTSALLGEGMEFGWGWVFHVVIPPGRIWL